MRNNATVVILISMALALGACGKSAPFSKSPSDTVVAAYMAANEGKYSEVERYLSSEAVKMR
jgi:predicted small lipoprotein YifL